jgi:heat shock protein HslJ
MSATRSLLPLLAAAALLAAGGCASKPEADMDSSAPTPVPATAAALAAFTDADLAAVLLVVGGERVALPAERPPTARFLGGGRLAGFSGVNRFTGGFTLGEDGLVTWNGGLAGTRLGGPPERLALEGRFLKALPATTRLGVMPDGVVFQSDDGANVVEFRR